ncbi:MAG: hypothetical protein WBA17_07285, partial [Saprospiraceae bacterium]
MPYRILTLLYVVVAAAMLIFWSGCDPDDDMSDPDPDPTCLNSLPVAQVSNTYCDPLLATVNFRAPQENPNLPINELCSPATTGQTVRYLRVINPGGNLVLHRYADYPGQFSYDLLAGNCTDGFTTIFCATGESGVIDVHTIENIPASKELVIRIVEETILYNADYNTINDRVDFAFFFDVPLNYTTDQGGELIVNLGCDDFRPARPSLILSGRDGEGIDVADIAVKLGLPIIKQCG